MEKNRILIRCFSFFSPKGRILGRLIENLSFGIASSIVLLFSPKPDVIYTNTWPIIATGLVTFIARIHRIPYIVFVQDLYPESLEAQGRMQRNSVLYRIFRYIDTQIARHAAHLIVISKHFAEIYREDRRLPAEKG